jgi:hypothetical protein
VARSSVQPELSNEVPLLVLGFAAGLPAPGDVEVPDDPLELVGAVVTGVMATGVLLTITGGAADPADTAVPDEVRMDRTGVLLAVNASVPIWGAVLRTSGIAVPADAAGRLGGNRSAGVTAGRSARPIAKKQANTAAIASTDTNPIRA